MRFPGCAAVVAILLGILPAARATLPSASEITKAFNALNTDGDRAISLEEWNASSLALFKDADKNKDNVLTLDELGTTSVAKETFALADLNHDGRLSLAEFQRMRAAIFNSMDIDRDGLLTYFEYELLTLLSQTGWNDINHNSRMEVSELRGALSGAFKFLDTNKDGTLAPDEVAYMLQAQFKLCDMDHDNRLTEDEFIHGYLKSLGSL